MHTSYYTHFIGYKNLSQIYSMYLVAIEIKMYSMYCIVLYIVYYVSNLSFTCGVCYAQRTMSWKCKVNNAKKTSWFINRESICDLPYRRTAYGAARIPNTEILKNFICKIHSWTCFCFYCFDAMIFFFLYILVAFHVFLHQFMCGTSIFIKTESCIRKTLR